MSTPSVRGIQYTEWSERPSERGKRILVVGDCYGGLGDLFVSQKIIDCVKRILLHPDNRFGYSVDFTLLLNGMSGRIPPDHPDSPAIAAAQETRHWEILDSAQTLQRLDDYAITIYFPYSGFIPDQLTNIAKEKLILVGEFGFFHSYLSETAPGTCVTLGISPRSNGVFVPEAYRDSDRLLRPRLLENRKTELAQLPSQFHALFPEEEDRLQQMSLHICYAHSPSVITAFMAAILQMKSSSETVMFWCLFEPDEYLVRQIIKESLKHTEYSCIELVDREGEIIPVKSAENPRLTCKIVFAPLFESSQKQSLINAANLETLVEGPSFLFECLYAGLVPFYRSPSHLNKLEEQLLEAAFESQVSFPVFSRDNVTSFDVENRLHDVTGSENSLNRWRAFVQRIIAFNHGRLEDKFRSLISRICRL